MTTDISLDILKTTQINLKGITLFLFAVLYGECITLDWSALRDKKTYQKGSFISVLLYNDTVLG